MEPDRIRDLLDEARFNELFVGLGWDNPIQPAPLVELPDDRIGGEQVAVKRGVGIWRIDGIPSALVRRRVDIEVSKQNRERLLVFVQGNEQLWLWPEQRSSGTGYRLVEHRYFSGARNDALVQRIAAASFTIHEEATLTVMDVLARVRRSFNAEEVTKRFYREFKQNHDSLLDDIEGIEDTTDRSWYGSVLLNRLMFIYFMQKKGFLDGDTDYLRNRLKEVRRHLGPDAFYGFFREFLLPLFHDGLGSHTQRYDDPAIAAIIGDVPYVNGGIFSPHLLETANEINVPDRAFEEIFEFFDRYRWHLDERPSDDPNEINPDVLGYIFEQYVNQKEQGAYYTKEDVTGYMTAATVIPAFLDRLDAGEDPWLLLQVDPDRYIFESVRYAVNEPLPEEIAAGIKDQGHRGSWSAQAPPSHGLPGETWWEVIDRRDHYQSLRSDLRSGSIRDPDAAVTRNIDLRTMVLDYLSMLSPISAVESAYKELAGISILDPTCGSGAFLFAALEILQDFYGALLERATELGPDSTVTGPMADLRSHPNRSYTILKSAVLSNLYGVDIMHEAGEIARLRLFLKLVAQLETRDELEPLPDLDFNIRTGNLLVGVAHKADAATRLAMDLLGYKQLNEIESAAESAAEIYRAFVDAQKTSTHAEEVSDLKASVVAHLAALREQLDWLVLESRSESDSLDTWRSSHLPFHWFIEYPEVFGRGGFDVVVGNPPYISRQKVTGYRWTGYRTTTLPDIFAPCVERSVSLVKGNGRFSMILPISFQFSADFEEARAVVAERFGDIWVSTYSRNPAALFSAGLGVRSSIVVASGGRSESSTIRSSRLNRWVDEYRPMLFENLRFSEVPESLLAHGWPRVGSDRIGDLLRQLTRETRVLAPGSRGSHFLRFRSIALYYISTFLQDPPAYSLDGQPIRQTGVGKLAYVTEKEAVAALAISLSKTALLWWAATSDDFHVTVSGLGSTPVPAALESGPLLDSLAALGATLAESMHDHIIYTKYAGKWMGNYDIKRVRHLTDEVDRLLLREFRAEEYWPDLELAYAWFLKATGERPGTLREMPSFE